MEDVRADTHQSAIWKICRLFLILSKNYGVKNTKGETVINIKLNQQMIGELLDLNRVTVTRKIKELRKQNLIRYSNNYYYIPDENAIRKYMSKLENN